MTIETKRINENLKESIILFRNHREDKKPAKVKEEVNFISSSLNITKGLARALADYSSYGNMGNNDYVLVEWKGKKYMEDYKVVKVGHYPNIKIDSGDRFRALEVVLNKILAEKQKDK